MSDFTKNLTRTINHYIFQSDSNADGLTEQMVEIALRQAAAETLADLGSVRLRREVSAELPRTILTVIENDYGEWLSFDPDEFAALRAMVLTWDENILQPGTTYITPVQLEGGLVVNEWQPEHDSANLQQSGDADRDPGDS